MQGARQESAEIAEYMNRVITKRQAYTVMGGISTFWFSVVFFRAENRFYLIFLRGNRNVSLS